MVGIKAAKTVRSFFPEHNPNFRFITLREPLKKDMIAFLVQDNKKESLRNPPPRVARVQVVIRDEHKSNLLKELLVDIDENKVISQQSLPGKHSHIETEYMQEVEKVCMTDPRVREGIKKLNLPSEAIVCVEPWTYATDGTNDMSERITMVRLALLGMNMHSG